MLSRGRRKKRVRTKAEPAASLHVGLTAEAVAELSSGIRSVMQMKGDRRVKLAALAALRDGCAVTNTTISGCYFTLPQGGKS